MNMKHIGKLLVLIFFLNVSISSLPLKNPVLTKIQEIVEYKPNELIIAIFVNLGDCIRCLQLPISSFGCAFKKMDNITDSIKLIAIVNCKREIEIKRFRKLYHWEGYCFFNENNTVQSEIGLPHNTWIAIFDKDSCIYYTTYEAYEQQLNCDSLTNLLRKIKLHLKRRKL